MNDLKVIAIDLAKHVFHVCILDRRGRRIMNKPMSRARLARFLATQAPSRVAMEACGSAHHWGRKAEQYGHTVVLISPKHVKAYRQGHKTDGNDALAIAVACAQPQLKTVGVKTLDQQSVQSDKRIQEHLSDQLTATGNLIRSLAAEFGVLIPKGNAALKRHVPLMLAEADNGLPLGAREGLNLAWQQWQTLAQTLHRAERLLLKRIRQLEPCQQLMALEGVGPKNAIGLYVAIGRGDQYPNGRQASACIGLTPKQHSTGGKTVLGGIGKFQGNQRLRASLITGSLSMVNALMRREPRTVKERWIRDLAQRRGRCRAAVALANKNVRTAWAMLHHNTSYHSESLSVA